MARPNGSGRIRDRVAIPLLTRPGTITGCPLFTASMPCRTTGSASIHIHFGILFGLAWSGYAIEAALLWWLPRHIALTYIQFYLSWAPHHPGNESGRYRDTRSFRSILGNIGSLGMQYHIIHHLHPRIPLYRTPQAYWEMKPILEARGCNVHEL